MYLSELYGRIGQILQEHGDMKVQRDRSLKIDGIVGTNISSFVDFSSEDFGILNDYKVEQIDENTFKGRKVGQHFIINIPFN
jgi:hypothetical protein